MLCIHEQTRGYRTCLFDFDIFNNAISADESRFSIEACLSGKAP
jgi:hypothetical protein